MQCTDPVAEGAQTHVAWANLMQMRSDVFVMYSLRTGLVFYCTALPLQLKSQGQLFLVFGFSLVPQPARLMRWQPRDDLSALSDNFRFSRF